MSRFDNDYDSKVYSELASIRANSQVSVGFQVFQMGYSSETRQRAIDD